MTRDRKSVLLLGATGMLGQECLRLLRESDGISRIVVLTRRPPGPDLLGAKTEARMVSFDRLTTAAQSFSVDAIICVLGTTMSRAASRRQFRAVNLVYPLTAAHLGIEKRVSHFLLASGRGADAGSRKLFSRTKGELEDAIGALPYRSLTIARPSTLRGHRKDTRLGERITGWLAFMLPAAARPINATDVAAVLVQAVIEGGTGKRVLEPADLRVMAAALLANEAVADAGETGHDDLPRASVA